MSLALRSQIYSAKQRFTRRLKLLMRSSERPPNQTLESWQRSLESSLLPKIKTRPESIWASLDVGDSVVVHDRLPFNASIRANRWAKKHGLDRRFIHRTTQSGVRVWRVK